MTDTPTTMTIMGAANRNGLRRSVTAGRRKKILEEAARQRDMEFAGGETKYTSGTPEKLDDKGLPARQRPEGTGHCAWRRPRGSLRSCRPHSI
ncbi:MAG: Dienelactone hydrolase [Labilithrix sp.]|nr:Dienelactone hydrolase [Labilithrix sp.]